MITAVTAKGFKGQDFDQPLGPRTLIFGPNGAGKSTRTQALILAATGKVPGVAGQNPAIMAAFAAAGSDKLRVGYRLDNGKHFERAWVLTAKGTVSQAYYVDGRKKAKTDFERLAYDSGLPRIIDIAAFIALSDEKKVKHLFDLYPPDGDVAEIGQRIQDLAEDINALRRKNQDESRAAATARKALAETALPAGTLAETRDAIARREDELAQAQDELAQAKANEAARKAKAEAKAEAEKKAEELRRAEKERAESERKQLAKSAAPEPKDPADDGQPPLFQKRGHAQPDQSADDADAVRAEAYAAITAIIETINGAGCGACAAKIVALKERRKFAAPAQGKEAA